MIEKIKEFKEILECFTRKELITLFVMLIFTLVVIGPHFYRPFGKCNNIREVTATVTGKVVKNEGAEDKYIIFVKDSSEGIHAYEITDSLFRSRFNSSDVYAQIHEGDTYLFTVGGSRSELLSWYPNIYEFQLVEEGIK